MQLITDMSRAVRLSREIREAQNAGHKISEHPVVRIPVIQASAWLCSIEGCLTYSRETEKAVSAVFHSLPEETQHALCFVPKSKEEWVTRAKFWKTNLAPALTVQQYHEAMTTILRWYRHVLSIRRKNAALDGLNIESGGNAATT